MAGNRSRPVEPARSSALIAHDQPAYRRGLRRVLAPFFSPVFEAPTAAMLSPLLDYKPDIVLMRLSMLEPCSETVKYIRRRLPGSAIFLVAENVYDHALLDGIRAGASGFVLGHETPEMVAAVIMGRRAEPARDRRRKARQDPLIQQLHQLECLCWRSRSRNAARVLSALHVLLLSGAAGSCRAQRDYLPRLARLCEAIQREYVLSEAQTALPDWPPNAPGQLPDELTQRRARRRSGSGP